MAEGALPDVEAGLVSFLLAQASITTLVSTRVFFGVPRNSPTLPLIVVQRVGGGDDVSEAAIDNAVVTLHCWGRSKLEALTVTNTVRTSLRSIRRVTVHNGVALYGIPIIDSVVWSPDPQDDTPRYILTARVTAAVAE